MPNKVAKVFLVVFVAAYYVSFLHFDYPSAPGGDLYNHYLYVKDLQDHGLSVFFHGYPKLFHLVVLVLAKLTGLPILKVMLCLVPAVMAASATAVAWLAYLLAGEAAAALALFLLLFVSAQPVQTLYDGGFPNYIAANMWLPLLLGSLYMAVKGRERRWIAWTALWGACLVATHAFSTFYAVAILASLLLYYGKRSWPFLAGGGFLLGIFLWLPVSSPAREILSTVARFGGNFPWVHLTGSLDNPNAMWNLSDYPTGISYLTVVFGVIGAFFLLRVVVRRYDTAVLAYLVLSWLLILFVGSRIPQLGFPVRLARDLGTPLAISAALAIVGFWRAWPFWGWRLAVAAVCLWLGAPHFIGRWQRLLSYEPTVLYSAADQEAVAAIGQAPAAALDQMLPTAAQPTIVAVYLDAASYADPVRARAQEAGNRALLSGRQYAFYEVMPGHDGEAYRSILEADGYVQQAVFSDPNKQVVLFRRQG